MTGEVIYNKKGLLPLLYTYHRFRTHSWPPFRKQELPESFSLKISRNLYTFSPDLSTVTHPGVQVWDKCHVFPLTKSFRNAISLS